MTRKLFICSTIVFWILVTVVGMTPVFWTPDDAEAAKATETIITPTELAVHATPEDCWMAIRGAVHDVSAYLPEHPSRPDIVLPWCGKESTEAYETKMKGRPHSPHADELLAEYRIGMLGKAP